MSPVPLYHIRIAHLLSGLIERYLEGNPIGEVLGDGFQMKVGPRRGRVPDLFFVRSEHRDRLKPTYLDGPADLVVEVVSKDSVKRDRVVKYAEYAELGIPEYWLIDTLGGVSEFNILEDGAYRRTELNDKGLFESVQLPGLRINTEWFTREQVPSTRSVLMVSGIRS